MSILVFVLGRAGCGKSTATRYMAMRMRDQRWRSDRITDYAFLYTMFKSGDRRFLPTIHGGFDIIESSPMNDVLTEVQGEILKICSRAEDRFITIEFARDDYSQALKFFNQDLLEQAYFLYIDTDLKTCTQRIHKRIEQPADPDNHFVSDTILREYYSKDSLSYMKNQFCTDFNIDPQRLQIIENTGTQREFLKKVENFLEQICNIHAQSSNKSESKAVSEDHLLPIGVRS